MVEEQGGLKDKDPDGEDTKERAQHKETREEVLPPSREGKQAPHRRVMAYVGGAWAPWPAQVRAEVGGLCRSLPYRVD